MNLFCFTLDGSTESVYEPAYSQTLKDVLPKYQCSSAMLSSRTEWGGSSPSISSSTPKPKKENRRSCVAASSSADGTSGEKVEMTSCWESNRKDVFLQRTVQDRDVCENDPLSDFLTQEAKEQSSSRTQTHQPAQSGETPAVTAESIRSTGRLKRLQNLVQARRGPQSAAGGGKSPSEDGGKVSSENPVLTCIGLGRRAEKKPTRTTPSPQEQTRRLHPDPEEDEVWSPNTGNLPLWSSFGCSQPWTPLYHSCHQPGHELWACGGGGGGTLSLPRTTEWDRFQSLIQELDNKQSPPQMIRSITDLHLSQNKSTRFGRRDASSRHSQDKTGTREREPGGGEPDGSGLDVSTQSDGKHGEASPQRPNTELNSGGVRTDGAVKTEAGGGRPFGKGRRRSSNSLESLYSFNSGQSSSSGVTSGSDCSSDGNSPRLDDDLSSTRRLRGRARVHTEYVPSPYDTESLRLELINKLWWRETGVGTSQDKGGLGLRLQLFRRNVPTSVGKVIFVCAKHFKDDCFSNLRQYKEGFAERLGLIERSVPSIYGDDEQSTSVGDVIDIIATPPMGIWRGSLKGKIGSFKFIYVDVLPDERQRESQGVRHRSTVQEVLRRLSLEEYSSPLQLAGYQTVDDLMKLSEPHLTRLNVTDPEHRQRLLAAVRSLQLLNADRQLDGEVDWENGENVKANINNCPRDSGCHMASEGSDGGVEEAELHFPSASLGPADATESRG